MHFLQKPNQTKPPPKPFFLKNAVLHHLQQLIRCPLQAQDAFRQIRLASAGSSGEKETPAATGSNAIPIQGNKKSFSKKPMPVNWAQSARPSPSAPRPAPKLSPQVKSNLVPSKRAIALKRATSTPLPKVAQSGPSNWRDQFPPLVPRQFLRSPMDQKMNSSSSKSFSHIASKGIKTGSKPSSLPSWSETWTMPKDWFSVPANEKNISPI